MITYKSVISDMIRDFVLEGIDLKGTETVFKPDSFWDNLRKTGTELWLDTGDMEEAAEIWTVEMSALTTNNTLLNKEIQKGIYDEYIKEADKVLDGMDMKSRILEIAFILNARHGLRLVEKFGGKVSVELHTDFAHDLQGIVEYGQRFHEICPDNFFIKVPYTATGLPGARRLGELGVPVNFTLEFSARQNALVTAIAKPAFQNVFLGRLGSYMTDNQLGNGKLVGEKATLSTQRVVRQLTGDDPGKTKLIAASLRNANQLENLAGINVFTIPIKVATEGKQILTGDFRSRLDEEYKVTLNPGIEAEKIGLSKLWEVTESELALAHDLDKDPPSDGEELIERARERGCKDMFPDLTVSDYRVIAEDGKIPVHAKWADRIESGELAIDTLLNLAGLASFAADQKKLDDRIGSIIGN
ncbi:MAG: hypothetical protein JSV24_02455 [Bacteroidales bacterium]|nr:MAG: hypothetical protein JSV24_02455 [Bacteroidales bacterium]